VQPDLQTVEEPSDSELLKGVPNVVFPQDTLLERIVEKHENYISKLQSDIESTMKRVEELDESIRENKREIEREKTLISVLNEKPKQLCHQISVMRVSLVSNLEATSPDVVEALKQPLAELEAFEGYIEKHLIEPEEGLERSKQAIPAYERVRDTVAANPSLSEQSRALDSILSKMGEVVDSYGKLVSMAGSQEKGYAHLVDELENARGHLSWATSRLKSHEGALIYWQQEKAEEVSEHE